MCTFFCWIFTMNFIVFFVSVILSCPFLLHSAMRNCPESFSCPNCVPFKYPFYNNGTDEGCGLIKVNCTTRCGEIRFGGQSYVIGKVDYGSTIIIYNRTFEELVKTNSCVALLDNFTSPNPLLFSISVAPFITLFKCTKNLSYDQELSTYFDQNKYNYYDRCKDHRFYYTYSISNTTVPSNLPHICQVIQLPVKEPWQFVNEVPDETNIFSLLNSYFSISFKYCPDHQCHKKGSQCPAQDGHFQCLDTKKDVAEKPRGKLILISVLAGSTFILMLSSVIFVIWRRYKSNPFLYVLSMKKPPDLEDRSIFNGVHVFSYTKLKDATQNFDPSLKLGDGGFGAVYYGKLKDGREVAVKRFYEHNYKRVQHFMNEVEILTRLRHPNLVLLYGCTSQQSRELLLVYEYIPNGTVAHHLHGKQANPSLLTWPIRMNIAIETASALVYLHASEIIHRDVKSNNILLDHNFCVKVADFGLSRLVPTNATHVSTAPQGTPGYLDPQYHQCYQLTDKSDVYSFGVVLIELISSMVAVDLSRSREEISLANLALNRIQRGDFDKLIDPVFRSNSDAKIMRMITSVAELAFLCLQYDSEMRPTMNEVLNVLMDIQAEERIDADENIIDFETLKPKTSSETNDSVVLLKDFRPSPVSVNGIWQSDNSASTTVSSNGDGLPIKNHIST